MLKSEYSTGKLIEVIDTMSEMDTAGFGQSSKLDYRGKARTIKRKTPQMGFTV